jgi:hypothetical protein
MQGKYRRNSVLCNMSAKFQTIYPSSKHKMKKIDMFMKKNGCHHCFIQHGCTKVKNAISTVLNVDIKIKMLDKHSPLTMKSNNYSI